MWNIQLDAVVDEKFRLFTLQHAGRRFSYEVHLAIGEKLIIGGYPFTVRDILHNLDTGVATALLGKGMDEDPAEIDDKFVDILTMNGFQDVTEKSTIDA